MGARWAVMATKASQAVMILEANRIASPGEAVGVATCRPSARGSSGRSVRRCGARRGGQDPLADDGVLAENTHCPSSSGPGLWRISSGTRSCRCRGAVRPARARRALAGDGGRAPTPRRAPPPRRGAPGGPARGRRARRGSATVRSRSARVVLLRVEPLVREAQGVADIRGLSGSTRPRKRRTRRIPRRAREGPDPTGHALGVVRRERGAEAELVAAEPVGPPSPGHGGNFSRAVQQRISGRVTELSL